MAAINLAMGVLFGVWEFQKSLKLSNDTSTSIDVVTTSVSAPPSNSSVRAESPDAPVPGTGGTSMPIRRMARRRGPLGERSAAKSQTHAPIRPPGRATRQISESARALIGYEIQNQGRGKHVEGRVLERQILYVAEPELCFRCFRSPTSMSDERLRRIDPNYFRWCAHARNERSENSGAAADLQPMRADRWLQPGKERLTDPPAPPAHELLIGLAVVKAMCSHVASLAQSGHSHASDRRVLRPGLEVTSGRLPSRGPRLWQFPFAHKRRSLRARAASGRHRAQPASREPGSTAGP